MVKTASIFILLVIAANVGAVPGQKIRRDINKSGYNGGSGGGYGRGSDEREGTVSQEDVGNGCSDEKSGSHELTYNRENLDAIENYRGVGGRSFSKASASASASSSHLNQNQKNNIVV